MTLGYEGKRSRVTRTSDRGGPAHGDRSDWTLKPTFEKWIRSLWNEKRSNQN